MQNESKRTPEEIAQDMRAAGLPDKYIQHNFAVMDKEKHKALSSKGGKISGVVRKYNAAKRKQAKQMLELVLFSRAGATEEELQELDDFRAWQRHRRYLKKKREAAGKDKKQ